MEIILAIIVVVLILIITDVIELSCYISNYQNLIYTFLKIAFYILYPIFIVYFLDVVKILWHNRDTTENYAWLLFYGGMVALIFSKYKILKYFGLKNTLWLLMIELFYAPFILITILLYFW